MSTIKQIQVKKQTYSFGNKSYTEEELVKAFPDAYQQYQMDYGCLLYTSPSPRD